MCEVKIKKLVNLVKVRMKLNLSFGKKLSKVFGFSDASPLIL